MRRRHSHDTIYSLKIIAEGQPIPVWRVLAVPAAIRMHELQSVIRIVMGWRRWPRDLALRIPTHSADTRAPAGSDPKLHQVLTAPMAWFLLHDPTGRVPTFSITCEESWPAPEPRTLVARCLAGKGSLTLDAGVAPVVDAPFDCERVNARLARLRLTRSAA